MSLFNLLAAQAFFKTFAIYRFKSISFTKTSTFGKTLGVRIQIQGSSSTMNKQVKGNNLLSFRCKIVTS